MRKVTGVGGAGSNITEPPCVKELVLVVMLTNESGLLDVRM